MIALHTTGHMWASDGSLLRADIDGGKWVATRYNAHLAVTGCVVGSDEAVHDQVVVWSRSERGQRTSLQHNSAPAA